MDFLCEVKTGLTVDENSSDGFTLVGNAADSPGVWGKIT
jgi:hypothetical protein